MSDQSKTANSMIERGCDLHKLALDCLATTEYKNAKQAAIRALRIFERVAGPIMPMLQMFSIVSATSIMKKLNSSKLKSGFN